MRGLNVDKMKDKIEITQPKKQPQLFGYKNYFDSFDKMFKKKKLPNNILISGQKGLGKATFAYHFINRLLSQGESKEYNTKSHSIDVENSSYKLLLANTHPNFFLIENNFFDKEIKIERIRELINFLNKTVYSKDLKIVLIDNAEYLNLNSTNALLKVIEEPHENTLFFIIHNNMVKISDTLKSRCNEFKFFFPYKEKKSIFENILKYYNYDNIENNFDENLHYDTPGNVLKYFFIFRENEINPKNDLLSSILYIIEKYQNEKDPELLLFLSFFIECYYLELFKKNKNNLSKFAYNQSIILHQINSIKKYNLNEKNVFVYIKDKLINEKR